MSICEEIKWDDNTGYYVKGKKVPKTVYGEVKSLERQLEEAIDLNERLIRFIDSSNGDFDKFQEMYSKLLSMCAKEQLKEKGDE